MTRLATWLRQACCRHAWMLDRAPTRLRVRYWLCGKCSAAIAVGKT